MISNILMQLELQRQQHIVVRLLIGLASAIVLKLCQLIGIVFCNFFAPETPILHYFFNRIWDLPTMDYCFYSRSSGSPFQWNWSRHCFRGASISRNGSANRFVSCPSNRCCFSNYFLVLSTNWNGLIKPFLL